MTKLNRSLSVVLAASLAATACSADSANNAQGPAEVPEQLPFVTVPLDDPADVVTANSGRADGPLRLGLLDSVSVDPTLADVGLLDSAILLDLLHDGLTALDADGNVIPALASSWEWNEAGDELQLNLADDATFADGSAVTPADVVESLTRLMMSGSFAGGRLDVIEGADQLLAGSADEVTGLSATGDAQVTITVTRPAASLPQLLAAPWFAITPADAGDDVEAAAGSGPYQVTASTPEMLELSPADGSEPVEVHLAADRTELAANLESGLIDWALVGDAGTSVDGLSLSDVDTGAVHLLLIDPVVTSVSSLETRRAVRNSIDADALVAGGFVGAAVDLIGGNEPCADSCAGDEAAGAAVADRVEAATEAADGAADAESQIEAARPNLTLGMASGAGAAGLADEVSAQLTAGGFDVVIEQHDPEQFGELLANGEMGMYLYGALGLSGAPAEYLVLPFSTVSSEQTLGLRDIALERTLAAVASASEDESADAVASAVQALQDRAIAVPLGAITVTSAQQDWVSGVEVMPGGRMDLSAVVLQG